MQNEFTAVIERDGEWFVAWCPEVPEANGQGKTLEECRNSLIGAISLVLKDRREDAFRGMPETALREPLIVDEARGPIASPQGPRVLSEA